MIARVEGIGSPNKGAELMLYAVAQKMYEQFEGNVEVCCMPRQGFRENYKLLGYQNISQLGHFTVKGIEIDGLIDLLPRKLLISFGIIKSKDVDVIIDASGLRYTDKWGAGIAGNVAKSYKRLRNQGKKIVMLPQALGPFTDPEVAKAVKEIFKSVDLCFARDDVSYKHITDLVGESSQIKKAPDFTNIVKPYLSNPAADRYRGYVIVVPNGRMFDKTSKSVSNTYYDYLCNFVNVCKSRGEKVLILNHEGDPDEKLCKKLASDTGVEDVFSTWDPLEIKTIIGVGKYVMSSRFHGCVSALSQGVPVVATSWNHKYEMLLTEYGIGSNVEQLNDSVVDVSMIERCEDPDVRSKIAKVSIEMKKMTEAMWLEVFSVL